MEAECSLTLQVSPGYGEEEALAGRHSNADFVSSLQLSYLPLQTNA